MTISKPASIVLTRKGRGYKSRWQDSFILALYKFGFNSHNIQKVRGQTKIHPLGLNYD